MADDKEEPVFGIDLETERLRKANKFIREIEEKVSDKKAFASLARRLPTLLLNSGLVLTIAYLMKRVKEEEGREGAKKPEELLLEFLTTRLKETGLLSENKDYMKDLDTLLDSTPDELSLMLDEALASAEALKIITEAKLGPGEGG